MDETHPTPIQVSDDEPEELFARALPASNYLHLTSIATLSGLTLLHHQGVCVIFDNHISTAGGIRWDRIPALLEFATTTEYIHGTVSHFISLFVRLCWVHVHAISSLIIWQTKSLNCCIGSLSLGRSRCLFPLRLSASMEERSFCVRMGFVKHVTRLKSAWVRLGVGCPLHPFSLAESLSGWPIQIR